MIVTSEFVFIHMPKTGGGFLSAAINRSMEARFCGPHLAYHHVPPEAAHLPAIAFRRNPWDWYVSLWAYHKREGADETFEELLRRAFAHKHDLYTRVFAHVVGQAAVRDGRVHLGRFEHLRSDFVTFLDRNDIKVPELREFVLTAAPVNTSERADYRSYYDDQSRELVASSRMARRYEF